MGHFLEVAYKVLVKTNKPLSSKEITTIALEKNWLRTHGKTPWQTMKSKLSTDILKNRENSTFMRTGQNEFALRDWKFEEEYIADRYQKALLDEDVVVFPSSSLKKYFTGSGFHLMEFTSGKKLLAELRPMSRRQAEKDFSVIQLVSVFIVKFKGKFLTYKRTRRLPESRLHGVYSIFFGGHLNPIDIPSLFDIFDPQNGATFLSRELGEELKFPSNEKPELRYRGLLYDDRIEISRQHLGIVYDVFTKSDKYRIGERGFLMDSKWETFTQIEKRLPEFENWSELIVDHERHSRQFELNRED